MHSFVTPYVGVWIETHKYVSAYEERRVTPYVGVWIETDSTCYYSERRKSHTLRGCVD